MSDGFGGALPHSVDDANLDYDKLKYKVVYLCSFSFDDAFMFYLGYGQERGGINCLLYNNHNEDVGVVYMETIPWFLRLYLHTLKIEFFKTDGSAGNGTTLPPGGRACSFFGIY